MTTSDHGPVDRLDAALIELLAAEPRVGALEASRRLRVARGTVQARLERMAERGVITGYGPEVDPAALGYEVTAFITLEIRQAGGHDPVAERLAAIPEVLEVHTITGAGDMLCRVVARTNADLQRVLDAARPPAPLPARYLGCAGARGGHLGQLRLDVRHVPVGHRRGHALRSTARHQPDVLARGLEADVVGLVGLRRYAEQGGVHLLGRRQVGDGMQHGLDSLGGRAGHGHS
ncbi:MAG: Lrp/AsnC family transcriptional regulator [Streptosporangiaceae bacterium]